MTTKAEQEVIVWWAVRHPDGRMVYAVDRKDAFARVRRNPRLRIVRMVDVIGGGDC